MKREVRILAIYLSSLFVISLIFSYFGYSNFLFLRSGGRMLGTPMLLFTIIGGIIALKATVSNKSLQVFLLFYGCLWLLKWLLIWASGKAGLVHIMGKDFRFDLIVKNYYATVSRLDTPMPFVIFWFINHFFTTQGKKNETVKDPPEIKE